MNGYIERKEYLNKLAAFKDKHVIKVITGVRRCGKSTLLELFRRRLIKDGVNEAQIITINLEDYDFYELRNPKALHAYIKGRLPNDISTYIFIDEIQHCPEFPDVINSLNLNKNTDIYVTGSNALMLSSEIATLISGRYVEISMLPLSFKEFVQGTKPGGSLSQKYTEYVSTSSFPYALWLDGQSEIRDYLEGIYNTIVVKDISVRGRISDAMLLESVLRFVFDSIGSRLSTKKIADTLSSTGRKADTKTIEKYLSALMDSFIVYRAKRYDIKGREHLKTLDKYYAVDIGLRGMLFGSRQPDIGHVLENIIYLELLRRGNDVYIGKVDDAEVDFIAFNGKDTEYFQAAATVRDKNTLKRELLSLQKIGDNYPKTILTLDDDPPADYDGIRRINALDWLMEGDTGVK